MVQYNKNNIRNKGKNMRKIVIANNKGGVAKTTTAYNLASYYAKKGRRVS